MNYLTDSPLSGSPCTNMYPGSWFMLDPELIIDFEDDDETLDIGIEYGKMITKTIAVFIKPTLGVGDSSDNDWAIKIGFRHMFPTLVLLK